MKFLILTGLVIVPCLNSFCQQKLLQFKTLGINDGLSSPKVNCALQDYEGFMWVGTDDGLNRYDGYNFTTYRNDPADSGSISGNYIRTIFKDHNNNLLICPNTGISHYDRNLDRFVNYRYEKSSALFNLDIIVNRIAEDSTGNLWLATNKGLIYFDRNKNTITQYMHEPEHAGSISSNAVICVFIDKIGRVWIGTSKGINLYIEHTRDFVHITHCNEHNENITGNFFLDIAEDKDGNLWFGSSDGLFYLENNPDNKKLEVFHFKNNPNDPNSISKERLKSLFIDNEGKLWIGSENGGINLYNKAQKCFWHYRIDEFNPMSLNNESINGISQDRNNNLWVCTHGGGINISVKNSGFIVHYKALPGASQSLSYNIVSGFLEDRFGQIWVGTDGGGLNLYNRKTGRFTHFNSNNSNLSSNAILCVTQGNKKNIWIGTWAGGLVNLNPVSKTFKTFTTKNSAIPDNNINSIVEDSLGNLWLGSYLNGLINYNIKANEFISYTTENSRICSDQISVIKADNKGKLYIGTLNGFQVFIPNENKFISFNNSSKNSNSLGDIGVLDILIENDTCVWLATKVGLIRFNPARGIFNKYLIEQGLPGNIIKGLTLDKSGILWISTNNGICRFDFRNKNFKSFAASDGLQSNEFTERSIYTTQSGVIMAGGINGFNLLNPDEIPYNKKIPPTLLTGFNIFNEKLKIGVKGSPLKKQISETKEVILSYKQSVLTFYFSVLDFTNPQKNQYAYMMENFDKDWTYCGNRREATYTNLSPGKYIFRVKGSNNDGIWNETGTALEITINPPWWKTTVAHISFVLLIFCMLIGFYIFRGNQFKRQKELLEKLVKERTHEIEEKSLMLHKQTIELNETNSLLEERQQYIEKQAEKLALSNNQLTLLNATKDKFFSIIAHDLRNPFNNILGFTEILNNSDLNSNVEKNKKITGQLYLSAKSTYNLLENLLEWSKTQSNKILFQPQRVDLTIICQEIVDILSLNSKNIHINYLPTEKIEVKVDVNMLKTIMRNLISNAIKFSHRNNAINILIVKNEDVVTVSVSDNGVGIKKENLNKLFDLTQKFSSTGTDQEKGSGLGLIICKEFVEKHGGQIWVESDPDSHRGGKGSDFKFTIPIKA